MAGIDGDSDSDDDESNGLYAAAGPAPLPPDAGRASRAIMSGTSSGSGLEGALGAEGYDFPAADPKASRTSKADSEQATGGREEWMLTPGEGRPSGGNSTMLYDISYIYMNIYTVLNVYT